MMDDTRTVAIPVPGPPRPLRLPQASRIQLDNGLLLRTVTRSRLPILDALLVVPARATADPPSLAGRTALTAELVDSGTHRRSQTRIANALDALGARVSVHAHWDFSAISLQVLPDRFGAALEIVADLALNASFPTTEFERGRAERLATILQDLEDPEALAGFAIARAIHGPDHIFGTPRQGTRTTVEHLDRNALVRCHGAGYRPAGAILAVAGDVQSDTVVREAQRAFAEWSASPTGTEVPLPAVERKPTVVHLVDRPGAPQSEVRLGTVGAARTSEDYFPLVVLNTILGGSFTSRLNTRLREQGGYTYGASSAFSFRRSAGPFVAGAAVFAGVTARAVTEIREEIERIRAELVPAEELDRAKRYMTLGMARGFEANGSVAARVADVELHGVGEDWWQRYAGRVDAVGADAVRDVAWRYLDPARLAVVVVGDAKHVRASLEALEIGPVVDSAVE